MQQDKVICETPTPGKKSTRIQKWKYDALHQAILKVVPKGGDGILFKELSSQIEHSLNDEVKENLGSIGWYTTCVKLDMEVKGETHRVNGSTPQRLIRR